MGAMVPLADASLRPGRYPHDQIRALLLFGRFARVTVVPAVLLIGLRFLMQLFSQVGAVVDVHTGGVAYMAHVGGFIFGIITARFFERFGALPNGKSDHVT